MYPSLWVASPLGNQPPPEHEQFPKGEERPKDRFVASGQPEWQVDVKVVRAIRCVATYQISQRAMAPVHCEVRLLPPDPLVVKQPKCTQVQGADTVMQSSEISTCNYF